MRYRWSRYKIMRCENNTKIYFRTINSWIHMVVNKNQESCSLSQIVPPQKEGLIFWYIYQTRPKYGNFKNLKSYLTRLNQMEMCKNWDSQNFRQKQVVFTLVISIFTHFRLIQPDNFLDFENIKIKPCLIFMALLFSKKNN